MAMMIGPQNNVDASSRGLLLVLSPDQTSRYEDQRVRDSGVMAGYNSSGPVITGLAAHIDRCWAANKTAKQPVETVLLECLRARNGEYEPDALAKLKEQGETDPIFMMVTDIKCRSAIAWIRDVLLPPGEVPAHLQPTPIPDLPPDKIQSAKTRAMQALQQRIQELGISAQQFATEQEDEVVEIMTKIRDEMQQEMKEAAREDADRMTEEVNDELVEGGWYDALDNFIDDFVTFSAAFLEGPIYRRKRKMAWSQQNLPEVVPQTVKEYECVSPLDVYPSSGAKDVNSGDLIIRKGMSPRDLQQMIGVDGYNDNAIREVLDLYAVGGLRQWLSIDSSRARLEDHHNESGDPEPRIDVLKFFGDVPGRLLRDWGVDEATIPDELASYPCIAYKVGPHVISARLNPHPLGKRNIYSASFIRKNNSIWGRGIPQVIADIQRMCNSAARALQRNMGIASGPMAWVIEDKVHPGQDPGKMAPWKVFRFTSEQTGSNAGRQQIPMGFFQPNTVVNELLTIYKEFYQQASEVSGVPAYMYGSEKIGGAGRTASGLAMLMNSASKGLRSAVMNIDKQVVRLSWEEHWLSIAMSEPERLSGDCKIIARASDYLMQIEQLQIAVAEALQLTGNPVDMQIIGMQGRSELLREYMRRLKIPVDKIVPSSEAIMQQTVNQQVQSMIGNLSQALGIPPDRLLMMAQQPAMAPGQHQLPVPAMAA